MTDGLCLPSLTRIFVAVRTAPNLTSQRHRRLPPTHRLSRRPPTVSKHTKLRHLHLVHRPSQTRPRFPAQAKSHASSPEHARGKAASSCTRGTSAATRAKPALKSRVTGAQRALAPIATLRTLPTDRVRTPNRSTRSQPAATPSTRLRSTRRRRRMDRRLVTRLARGLRRRRRMCLID